MADGGICVLRLYAYAGLAIAVLGGGWWLHNHLVDKGVQQQREADAEAYAKLQRDADLETGRLKGLADAAEKANAEELKDLRQYRADHPLHGSLRNAVCNRPAVPDTSASNGVNDSSSAIPRPIQPVPEGDRGRIDQLHLLDVLAGKADGVSAQLREWQAR